MQLRRATRPLRYTTDEHQRATNWTCKLGAQRNSGPLRYSRDLGHPSSDRLEMRPHQHQNLPTL
jgi:hypothetical protein